MFGRIGTRAKSTLAFASCRSPRADARIGDFATAMRMAWRNVIVCGTDGLAAFAVTPGAGVPTAGYGSVSVELAGGSVGIADGAIVGTGIGVGTELAAGCAFRLAGRAHAVAMSNAAADVARSNRRVIG